MYRKIAVAGITAAAILGAGTAALAASGPDATGGAGSTGNTTSPANPSSTSTPAPTSGNGAKKGARARVGRALMRHAVHGSIVTHGKDGYVRHTGIRGTVSAVSPTSLTVKAADGVTQTFTLTKDTKVRERSSGQAKPTAGSISDLKSGDSVGVLGREAEASTAAPTATVVIDGLK